MVKVYTIQSCPWCAKVKKYLKSKDVEFEELDIEKDAAAREACKKLTGMDYAVPVTTIDNENFVMDYDKEALDKLVCL
ncbi:MAG: glutathione S-transferase N-terminal domain-containing protein [Selenomonadaceae bacterium]|nr:glutathione S-transferase N-terminal domain-containing protein [Selenomonadaceae bacterium]